MHFSKILVTTDFSEESFRAFDIVAYEAKMEATEIRLINVLQYYFAIDSAAELAPPPLDAAFYEDCRATLKTKLDKIAVKYFHAQKVTTEVILSLMSPANAVCSYAAEHGSEVIVLASKGHGALAGLLLGSTVQRVLALSPCPVLVVPVRK